MNGWLRVGYTIEDGIYWVKNHLNFPKRIGLRIEAREVEKERRERGIKVQRALRYEGMLNQALEPSLKNDPLRYATLQRSVRTFLEEDLVLRDAQRKQTKHESNCGKCVGGLFAIILAFGVALWLHSWASMLIEVFLFFWLGSIAFKQADLAVKARDLVKEEDEFRHKLIERWELNHRFPSKEVDLDVSPESSRLLLHADHDGEAEGECGAPEESSPAS